MAVCLFSLSLQHVGISVALAKADTLMKSFGVVIIDEAHVHSASADILLCHLKSLLTLRDDLRLVIMSAAINTALFTNYFPQAVVKEVSTRRFKVTVNYLDHPPSDVISEIVNTILYVHLTQMPGDILVFVTGKGEIKKVINGVKAAFSNGRFEKESMGPLSYHPVHGNLTMGTQMHAINAPQHQNRDGKLGRKIIVSTNSTETSLTIHGVTHVIDSCKVKVKMWNLHTESWRMLEQPISKTSALHRKGRAGCTSDGMAWLMCTERGYHENLVEDSVPQFLQGDMLSECLTIKALGHNPVTFDYIVAPAPETIVKALELLQQLGAIDHDGQLLPQGEELTAVPTNVYAALTILESRRFDCSDEIISTMAMVEAVSKTGSAFIHGGPHDKILAAKLHFQHPSGDHLTLFNIYMAWRTACQKGEKAEHLFLRNYVLDAAILRAADGFRLHWLEALGKIEFWWNCELAKDDPNYYTRILQALAAGHYLKTAKRNPSSNLYQLVRSGMDVFFHKDNILDPSNKHNEWVIYDEYWDDGLRVVSTIKPELLVAAQPEYWWDTEFLPQGHIKDGLLQTLAGMIGDGSLTPPVRQWADVGDSNWAGLARWVQRCAAPHNRFLQEKLPSWQSERNSRSAKVEQLKRWGLETAISAGFDDGSSQYEPLSNYRPASLSVAQLDARKLSQKLAQKKKNKGRGHGRGRGYGRGRGRGR